MTTHEEWIAANPMPLDPSPYATLLRLHGFAYDHSERLDLPLFPGDTICHIWLRKRGEEWLDVISSDNGQWAAAVDDERDYGAGRASTSLKEWLVWQE